MSQFFWQRSFQETGHTTPLSISTTWSTLLNMVDISFAISSSVSRSYPLTLMLIPEPPVSAPAEFCDETLKSKISVSLKLSILS